MLETAWPLQRGWRGHQGEGTVRRGVGVDRLPRSDQIRDADMFFLDV
jgi:hypothetical protein